MLNNFNNINAESSEVFVSYGKVITNKDGIIEIVGLEANNVLGGKATTGRTSRTAVAKGFNSLSLRSTALLPVVANVFRRKCDNYRTCVRYMMPSPYSGAPAPKPATLMSPADATLLSHGAIAAAGYYATVARGKPGSVPMAVVSAGVAVAGRLYAQQSGVQEPAISHKPSLTVRAISEVPIQSPIVSTGPAVMPTAAVLPYRGVAPASIFYPSSPAMSIGARRSSGPSALSTSPEGLRPTGLHAYPKPPTAGIPETFLPGPEFKSPGNSKFLSVSNTFLGSGDSFSILANGELNALTSTTKGVIVALTASSFFGTVYLVYVLTLVCVYYLAVRVAKYFN